LSAATATFPPPPDEVELELELELPPEFELELPEDDLLLLPELLLLEPQPATASVATASRHAINRMSLLPLGSDQDSRPANTSANRARPAASRSRRTTRM
jgi:hypothetical protein